MCFILFLFPAQSQKLVKEEQKSSQPPRTGVVGLYLLTPNEWRSHDVGGPKLEFMLRHVAALKEVCAC